MGKGKVIVGIPFYCHAYKLLTSKMHGYHAIAIGKGECEQTGYTCVSLYHNWWCIVYTFFIVFVIGYGLVHTTVDDV